MINYIIYFVSFLICHFAWNFIEEQVKNNKHRKEIPLEDVMSDIQKFFEQDLQSFTNEITERSSETASIGSFVILESKVRKFHRRHIQ